MEGKEKRNREEMVSICTVFNGEVSPVGTNEAMGIYGGWSLQLLIDPRHHHASAAPGDPAPDFSEAPRSEGSGRSVTQNHPRDSAIKHTVSSLSLPFPKLTPISGRFSKVPSLLGSVPQFCRDRVMRPTALFAQLNQNPWDLGSMISSVVSGQLLNNPVPQSTHL